jgi:predicted SAM-dependent methyltransferase
MTESVRLFVGTGVEGFRPEGYKTIDISPDHKPDIVADASSLPMVETGSADEFYASHVLEHFSWPRGLLVLNEWARVLKPGGLLKIAVPDMEVYAHFLINGQNPFNVMNDIYGGHWAGEGGPQGHHFGYTRRMLVEALITLGFGDFGFWRSELQEAANAWMYGENQERLGVSLNISGIKKRAPLLDIEALYHRIRYHDLRESFSVLVRQLLLEKNEPAGLPELDGLLFQKLNYQYLEATHLAEHFQARCQDLESRLKKLGHTV